MLVLSRKKNESIIIGDNIVITVVDIRGDKVRLGIQAPVEIPILRSEIHIPGSTQDVTAEDDNGIVKVVQKDSSIVSGGTPDNVIDYHNILSSGPNLTNDYVGLRRLSGSYRSLKNELAYCAARL